MVEHVRQQIARLCQSMQELDATLTDLGRQPQEPILCITLTTLGNALEQAAMAITANNEQLAVTLRAVAAKWPAPQPPAREVGDAEGGNA